MRTPDDQVFITMRHANAAYLQSRINLVATPSAPKERDRSVWRRPDGHRDSFNSVELWSAGKLTKVKGAKDTGQETILADFVRACRGGEAWPIPWEHLYSAAWAPLAAMQSLRTGAPVDIHSSLD